MASIPIKYNLVFGPTLHGSSWCLTALMKSAATFAILLCGLMISPWVLAQNGKNATVKADGITGKWVLATRFRTQVENRVR